MALSLIEQGKRLLIKKKYHEVIKLLEPHVFEYRDSFAFHFYLGLSFLHIGEIGNAVDYFSAARKLKPNDTDLMAAQAVMYLRRNDTRNAVDYYLRILDILPNSKLAKKGLIYIQKNNTPETLGSFVQSGKIKKLYPVPYKNEIRGRWITFFLIICITAITGGVIIPFISKNVSFSSERANITELNLDSFEKKRPIDMEGSYIYVLTSAEVLDAFSKAQKYFQNFRDNEAQIEINKILNSNASFSIKKKAGELAELLQVPRFDTIKNIYSFDKVREEPALYQDCWVVWKGMPSNVKTGTYSTVFNLLVGYDTKHTLEGVVPVFCEFVEKVDSERPISVLGQIKIKDGNVICLKGTGLHQSGAPAIKN